MKENAILKKININKNEFIKVKREKELKKIEQNGIEVPALQTIDLTKNDSRNITAPNKVGIKQKKNYKHLKITAKNKEIKDTNSSNAINNKQNNVIILLSKKMLGRSLPKNYNYNNISNNIKMDIPNDNSNNIKRITSSNNLVMIKNNNEIDNFQKIKNIYPKNNSNGFKNNAKINYKNGIVKEFRENKFINKNNQIKKHNQHEVSNDTLNSNYNKINRNNFDIKIVNKKIIDNSNNKKIRPNNSFNNSSNAIFNNRTNNYYTNEGKGVNLLKKQSLKSNHLQNLIMNNIIIYKTKRSMSSSINIQRNKLKEMNNQELLNGLVIYPENELLRSVNNNAMFSTILENEKIPKNRTLKNKNEDKNALKKKNNLYQYLILKGNASYLIKNCMSHRVNWAPTENPLENLNNFNFKWKELSYGIDYNNLNRNPGMKQIVNHYENHYVISNKANMFINLMKYCEQRKISIFKYVPFTIVFKIKDRRKIKNTEKQQRWTEKLEKLKHFIQNIDKNIKNYSDIGKFYDNEEYIKDKDKRMEFEKLKLIRLNKKKKEKEMEENKEKEKSKKEKINKEKEVKIEDEKYNGKFKVYSDIFPRLKITDKLPTRYKSGEEKEKDKKMNEKIIGDNTLIEIPTTHFKGKNMWVLKAVNLNRGMCIKIVNSFEQMEKVINRFKNGVDYRFTIEEMEEKEENQIENQEQPLSEDEIKEIKKPVFSTKQSNAIKIEEYDDENDEKDEKEKKINNKKEIIKTGENNQKKINNNNNININNDNKKEKEEDKEEKIYNCNKILIQKYIENPLLYKGRKCDMRIWVLLTHQMKVFLFKEGHLKTCSVEYDLNSQNAFTHITNYSFQKYNENFQKFEKGNEVPFYEFQKFIDKEYPEKKYKIKKDLMKKIKEIITLTMRSGKEKINKNGRSHQFEIFGYDFMLDSDFNVFLIEINTNPGLEISSPWIQIVVPRMLDDALRLTVDKVFEPIYDFSKNYKGDYTEEQKKVLINSKIEVDFNAVSPNIDKESSAPSSVISSENKNMPNISKNSSNLSSSINKNISYPPTTIESTNNNNNIFKINLDLDETDKKTNKEENNNNNINDSNNNNIKDNNNNNIKDNINNNNININIKDNNQKNNKNNKDYKEITKDNNNKKNINIDKRDNKENKDNKINKNNIKENKTNKENKDVKGKKENRNIKPNEMNAKKYISPFPVPGYSLDENLWDFVCDLNSKDPFEIKNEKEINMDKEKELYTGIRHLLKKKEKKNKGGKGNPKKNNNKKKNKNNKNIKENNKEKVIKSPDKENADIQNEEIKVNKNLSGKK